MPFVWLGDLDALERLYTCEKAGITRPFGPKAFLEPD
jgi:hypothetical protein